MIVVFTAEFGLRLLTVRDRLAFWRSPLNIARLFPCASPQRLRCCVCFFLSCVRDVLPAADGCVALCRRRSTSWRSSRISSKKPWTTSRTKTSAAPA